METPSLDTLCKIYIKIRTKKQEITKDLESQIEALDAQLKEIAVAMKEHLQAAGGTSIKTPHGTIFLQTKTRYYFQDWGAASEWIKANDALDLLEKRVAQGNMAKWLEEFPTNVPTGLQAEAEVIATVRKA